MMGAQESAESKHTIYEKFHHDQSPAIRAFREYWQKESEAAQEASSLLAAVVSGKVAVSEEVIANCRRAVMRLHQIHHALGQLIVYVHPPCESVQAAKDVVLHADMDAAKAEMDLKTILKWVAAANPEQTIRENK